MSFKGDGWLNRESCSLVVNRLLLCSGRRKGVANAASRLWPRGTSAHTTNKWVLTLTDVTLMTKARTNVGRTAAAGW